MLKYKMIESQFVFSIALILFETEVFETVQYSILACSNKAVDFLQKPHDFYTHLYLSAKFDEFMSIYLIFKISIDWTLSSC